MATITEMGLPGEKFWVRRSKDHFTQRSVTFEEYVTSKFWCQVVSWIYAPILRGMFGRWENIVLVTLYMPELCSLPIFTTSVNVNSIYSGQQSRSHHGSSLSLSIAILSANTDLRSNISNILLFSTFITTILVQASIISLLLYYKIFLIDILTSALVFHCLFYIEHPDSFKLK